MFLSLAKGKKGLKALLVENITKNNPENNKDDQLEWLQYEMAEMRIQMIGQMALIQNLARGKKIWDSSSTSFIRSDTTVCDELLELEIQSLTSLP